MEAERVNFKVSVASSIWLMGFGCNCHCLSNSSQKDQCASLFLGLRLKLYIMLKLGHHCFVIG